MLTGIILRRSIGVIENAVGIGGSISNNDLFGVWILEVSPGVGVILDRPRGSGMSHQRLQQFSCHAAGNFDRVIPMRRCHGFSIGRKSDRNG